MLHGGALRSIDTWIQLYGMKETNTVTLLNGGLPIERTRVDCLAKRSAWAAGL